MNETISVLIKPEHGSVDQSAKMVNVGKLPIDFIAWQMRSRMDLLRMVEGTGVAKVRNMPSHLPVVATYGKDLAINLSAKGIGLLPRADHILGFTSKFRQSLEKYRSEDPESTINDRLQVLLELYSDPANFDPEVLGGLEIFEGVTYANLRRDPRIVLLFNGDAPDFISYQVEGLARFVDRGDASYEYLLASRELFAHDRFHVHQSNYPHGFVVQVGSVREKRPFSRG